MFPLGPLRNSEMHHKKGGQLALSIQFRKHQLKVTLQPEEIHPQLTDTGVSQVRSFVPMSTHPPPFYNLSAQSWGEQNWERQTKKSVFGRGIFPTESLPAAGPWSVRGEKV